MSNPYYDHTTYPASGASGSSAALRAELDAIEAGFDKLPVLSGNALKLVRVNAGATALEASDAAASGVACTPSGNLASTNVQAALVELQGDIDTLGGFSLDADLSAIAALTGTGFAKRTGTNAWSLSSAVALGSEVSGTLGVGNGGTGQTSFTNGQLLIGNTTGNTLTKATLTAGTNISITNGAGAITINNTQSIPTITTEGLKSLTVDVNTPANGFTITVPAQSVKFRSTTATDGTTVTRTNSSAATLVVPSGATLGTSDGVGADFAVLLVDNGTGFDVAIKNLGASSPSIECQLAEEYLISTEAISAAADTITSIYSTNALTSKPFIVYGLLLSTQTTAGTWTSAFSLVQGMGNQVVVPKIDGLRLYGRLANGTTNTSIPRFANVEYYFGGAVVYTDSAADGASFRITKSGVYDISYSDNFTSACNMGISRNSSQLTTNIASITASDVIAITTAAAANWSGCASTSVFLKAGTVIRPHASSVAVGTATPTFSIMRRI